MVFSGSSSAAPGTGDALLVFDTVTKSLTKTIPLGGRWAGKLVEAEPGKVVVVNDKSPTQIFKVDIDTDKFCLTNKQLKNLCLAQNSFNHLIKGPDGYGWLYFDTNLSRLNLQTVKLST